MQPMYIPKILRLRPVVWMTWQNFPTCMNQGFCTIWDVDMILMKSMWVFWWLHFLSFQNQGWYCASILQLPCWSLPSLRHHLKSSYMHIFFREILKSMSCNFDDIMQMHNNVWELYGKWLVTFKNLVKMPPNPTSCSQFFNRVAI